MSTRDRRTDVVAWRERWVAPPRTMYTSETKPFFLTSEFLAYILFLAALAIATATDDSITPSAFWTLATALTGLYIVSRGIAKAGSKSAARDPREEIGRD